jgi:hypothetical protein
VATRHQAFTSSCGYQASCTHHYLAANGTVILSKRQEEGGFHHASTHRFANVPKTPEKGGSKNH